MSSGSLDSSTRAPLLGLWVDWRTKEGLKREDSSADLSLWLAFVVFIFWFRISEPFIDRNFKLCMSMVVLWATASVRVVFYTFFFSMVSKAVRIWASSLASSKMLNFVTFWHFLLHATKSSPLKLNLIRASKVFSLNLTEQSSLEQESYRHLVSCWFRSA